MDELSWLSHWYYRHCDGDWEHDNGVKIDTLDNPGWTISINLESTELEFEEFNAVELERSENDWIHCRIEENKFRIACGPLNLSEALKIFREWAELHRM